MEQKYLPLTLSLAGLKSMQSLRRVTQQLIGVTDAAGRAMFCTSLAPQPAARYASFQRGGQDKGTGGNLHLGNAWYTCSRTGVLVVDSVVMSRRRAHSGASASPGNALLARYEGMVRSGELLEDGKQAVVASQLSVVLDELSGVKVCPCSQSRSEIVLISILSFSLVCVL